MTRNWKEREENGRLTIFENRILEWKREGINSCFTIRKRRLANETASCIPRFPALHPSRTLIRFIREISRGTRFPNLVE